MTTSTPDLRYWSLSTTHPYTNDPISYTFPFPLTQQAAALLFDTILDTYTVTDLTWHLDNENLSAVLVLYTLNGTQRLTVIAATDPDDAVVRLEAIKQHGSLCTLV